MSGPASRLDPPYGGDELTMLRAYLDYHRETFRWKTSGLTQAQLAQTTAASTLTLAGLLKHVALVEDWWFSVNFGGAETMAPFTDIDFDADPEWEFRTAVDDTPEELHALLDHAIAASDAVTDRAGDPLALSVRSNPRTGEHITLRWVLLHMIEEYARHNGHADFLREAIDGLTGE